MAKTNLTAARINGVYGNGKLQELRDHKVINLYLRVRPNGTRSWVVRYTDPATGEKRKLYTLHDIPTDGKSLEDARDAARRFLGDLLKNRKSPKTIKAKKQAKAEQDKRKAVTIGDLIPLYEPFIAELKTLKTRLGDLWLVARSNLGQKPITALTANDILAFIKNERQNGRKNRTINKKLTELYGMMTALYRHQIIEHNEVALPPKPKKLPETDSRKNRRYFEPWERSALVENSRQKSVAEKFPWLHAAVVLSLHTGIRPNSLFHLTWNDIDWKAKTLRLDARFMKTRDEWTLPFNSIAETALKSLQDSQEKEEYPKSTEYIFGKAVSKDEWVRAFEILSKHCGIKNATWYNMRHDFASQLVMKGVPLITVRDLMCHKNISTTQVYAHLAPDLKTEAVKLLEQL